MKQHMTKWYSVALVALLGILALSAGCGNTPASPTPAATQSQGAAPAAALSISGAVEKPVSWSLADLKKMALVKLDLMHPKTGKQSYEGVRLTELLNAAKPTAAAKTLTVTGRDGYMADVALADAMKCTDCLIAIDNTGALSAAMPNMPSGTWVRDLVKLEVK
jgi:hypothetical protein